MHADVDAREPDRKREQVERGRCARDEEAQHRRAGEARRRVPRRERRAAGQAHERVRMGIAERRPLDVGRGFQRAGEALRREVGERDREEQRRPAPYEREPERDQQPDSAPGPDARQPDEDLVERVPPVVDDPPLPVPVESGQVAPIVRRERSSSSGRSGAAGRTACPRSPARRSRRRAPAPARRPCR